MKKNATILKFEERLDHGNGKSCILAARIYTSPNGAVKTHTEGKNPEWDTLKNLEVTEATTETIAIKRETTDEKNPDKK